MRPFVTAESIAMCLKSGNVSVFRGSPEWNRTTSCARRIFSQCAEEAGVPPGAFSIVERPEKEVALELNRGWKSADAIVPRGGAGLRRLCWNRQKCLRRVMEDNYPWTLRRCGNTPMTQKMAVN